VIRTTSGECVLQSGQRRPYGEPVTTPTEEAPMTTTTTTAAAPAAGTLATLDVLFRAGYTLQTSVHPDRGTHRVWVTGPAGMAGFHATLQVSPKTGRITRAQLLPHGESGPVENLSGPAKVHAAVAETLRAVEAGVTRPERDAIRTAAMLGGEVPTTAELDAVASVRQPGYGDLVRYHGSQVAHHGVWVFEGHVQIGPATGRVVLRHPTDRRQTLLLSVGSRSITVLRRAARASA